MARAKERAIQLLILIDDHTERGADGELTMFWVPRANTQYINFAKYDADGHLPQDKLTPMDVSGSGDAAILKALEKRGLIIRPKTSLPNKYIYAITEEGRCEVERYRAGGSK